MRKPAVNAPEINTKFGWVNTDKEYSIADFKGKIVLLDFWTYGCINCQHIIPDLEKLEHEYKDELVVIGIHSGKFSKEKENKKIQEAILKFGIHHPVVNDADYKIWNAYAVRAWPTVVLISPEGKVVGQHAGENVYSVVKPYIESMIKDSANLLNKKSFSFNTISRKGQPTQLSFPGKLTFDPEGNIWLSDSGNNRILRLSPKGNVLTVIGSGKQGFDDGTYAEAEFYEPQGIAIKENFLYIADTKNNAIRQVNLSTEMVRTIAGSGELDYYFFNERWGEEVKPNSPWDLLIVDDFMYVASAGNHQILRMDLKDFKLERFAGTGKEALGNGSFANAAFNQPSGLAYQNNTIYVADAEASAIRAIDLNDKIIYTPLGKGLFEFGDVDGSVEDALLQHCMALAIKGTALYIADTYNNKIKVLDLYKERVRTLVAGLNEPNDIKIFENDLWITDTHNHQLIKINLDTNKKEIINIQFS